MAYSSNNITDWYTEALGRAPDAEGLNFWTKQLATGADPQSLYNSFIQSATLNNEKVNSGAINPINQPFDKYSNVAPISYKRDELPKLNENTNNAINAAINQAIANNRANGYAPESGSTVNTLRGWFSGNQAEKDAAMAAAQNLLQGVSGTADYGYNGIRGDLSGMNTNAYQFSTPYQSELERLKAAAAQSKIDEVAKPQAPQGLLAQSGMTAQNQGLLNQGEQQNWMPAQQNQQQNLMQGIIPFQFSSLNNPFQMPTTMMTQPQQTFNAPTQQQMGLLSNADRFQGQQRNRYGLL